MIDDRKEKREQENNKRFVYERDVKRAALEQEMISQRDKEMAYQHKAMLQVGLSLSLSPIEASNYSILVGCCFSCSRVLVGGVFDNSIVLLSYSIVSLS